MSKDELRREKLEDDYRDDLRAERWERFKSGLDLYDEQQEFLNNMNKDELVELINYSDCDYSDELDEHLRDVYEGEY